MQTFRAASPSKEICSRAARLIAEVIKRRRLIAGGTNAARFCLLHSGEQKCGEACRVFTWWSDDDLEDEQKFEGGKDGPLTCSRARCITEIIGSKRTEIGALISKDLDSSTLAAFQRKLKSCSWKPLNH